MGEFVEHWQALHNDRKVYQERSSEDEIRKDNKVFMTDIIDYQFSIFFFLNNFSITNADQMSSLQVSYNEKTYVQ